MFRKLFVAVVITGGLVLIAPTPAYAVTDYLDEATQGLQSSSVYVSPQVTDLSADLQASLESQIGTAEIALVVLPASARSDIDSIPAFLTELAARTSYDTILVSIGNDFEAGSSALPSGVASTLANEAEGGDLYDGLSEFVQAATTSETVQPEPSSDDWADTAFWTILIGGGLAVVVVIASGILIATGGFAKLRNPLSSREQRQKTYAPKQLSELLDEIKDWAYQIDDSKVSHLLVETERHVNELFRRLPKRKPDMVQQVTAQYRNVLGTVLKVAERFADIEQHPLYFKDPKSLIEDGLKAVTQYHTGVIQNIREIEQGSITDFNVDVKILAATVKEESPDYLYVETPQEKRKKR